MEALAYSVSVPLAASMAAGPASVAVRRQGNTKHTYLRHGCDAFSQLCRPSTRLPSQRGRVVIRAAEGEAAGDAAPAAAAATVPTTAEDPLAYKHLLLPIMDRNPFLNEATRQAIATATAMAKRGSADITVVVIDEDQSETKDEHNQRLESIRFHLAQGGFSDFSLLERLGEGKMPAAVVGEIADDLGLDLVVMSMEAIHHKHVDSNLLAEFVPCPVLLLPL
ncbi:unnamed protein product [Closterium sp. Naga37s-1]|nr:unnamed protein product [Closterium sp. Naga37s-1]